MYNYSDRTIQRYFFKGGLLTICCLFTIFCVLVLQDQKPYSKEKIDIDTHINILLGELSSKDGEVRLRAVCNLRNIGPRAVSAVPALILTLKDDHPWIRLYTVEALGNMGGKATSAVPALILTIKNEDEYVRSAALEALGRIVPITSMVSVYTESLRNKSWIVRREALSLLMNISPQSPTILSDITERLKDENSNVKIMAAYALFKITHNGDMLHIITNGLKDKDKAAKYYAANALGYIGTEAVSEIPALIEALKDKEKDCHMRSFVATALGRIGPEAAIAVPELTTLMEDMEEDVRVYAAYALAKIVSKTDSAMFTLINALKDKKSLAVRNNAAVMLAEIGPKAASAISALTELLSDKDNLVRKNAAMTLGNIGLEALPVLINTLSNHEDWLVRSTIAEVLGNMEPKPISAISALIETLKDKDWFVRENAAIALGKMGAKAESAIPALSECLKDKNEWVRQAAAEAIEKIKEGK